MKLIIVVEGKSDVAILRAVLPNDALNASDMYLAGGRATLSSFARTLLVQHHRPLALVLDTDSLNPSLIAETIATTDHLLRSVAVGTPFKVVYCIPEIEVVFFEAKIDLKRIFPRYDPDFFLMS